MDERWLLTWDAMESQLRSRVAEARRGMDELRQSFHDEEAGEAARCEAVYRECAFDPLEGLIPLVDAMKHRPSARAITLVKSLHFLRLFRPGGEDFAWIDVAGPGRLRLRSVRFEVGMNGFDTLAEHEGDLAEIVERLERLIEG